MFPPVYTNSKAIQAATFSSNASLLIRIDDFFPLSTFLPITLLRMQLETGVGISFKQRKLQPSALGGICPAMIYTHLDIDIDYKEENGYLCHTQKDSLAYIERSDSESCGYFTMPCTFQTCTRLQVDRGASRIPK